MQQNIENTFSLFDTLSIKLGGKIKKNMINSQKYFKVLCFLCPYSVYKSMLYGELSSFRIINCVCLK